MENMNSNNSILSSFLLIMENAKINWNNLSCTIRYLKLNILSLNLIFQIGTHLNIFIQPTENEYFHQIQKFTFHTTY